ncbi:MAG: hypothetical protein LCH30_09620, partial [Proteobacteria bacterium]|nr:hypothetical protein [Pseudomonadota bacterium]
EKQKQEEQRKEKYAKLKEELKGKSIGELIKELGAAIPFSMKLQDMVSPLGRNFDTGLTLKKIVRSLINSAVIEKKGIPDPIILSMMEKIDDFKNIGGGSFESVIAQINALVPILVSLAEKGVINELKTYPLSQLDGEKFKKLIEFLDRVGDRESSYQSLINALWNPLLKQSDDFDKLTNKLHQFIDKKFPAAFIGTVAHWLNNTDDKEHENLIKEVVKQDVTDPIFISIMQHPELEAQTVLAILALSKGLSNEQKADVAKMLNLEDKTKLATFLASFATVADEEKPTILAFLGKAFNNSSEEVREKTDYKSLIEHIQGLDSDKKKAFLAKDCFDLAAVDNLSVWLKDNKIADIPDYLEKNPHGKRDDAKHFGLDASGGFKEQDHLERIVNSSRDLSNDSAYSYQYRKQMMEAFLFINEIGHSLPAYKNKPIKDCTNAELKGFFQELKDNKDKGLSPFQKRLIAIAIIRETIYRTTGKFPHSTQIIALIDSIMHEGDFISQINTGEGKSMIDCMKASLLWLDSDRVDLTTSSIEDARRDIAEFKPFFELLEIPVSTNPISASRSGFADYKTDGINFSTVAQLSLFFAKARVSDEESAKNLLKEIDDPNKSVSLVLNESDYALLDDSVIYRLAMGIGGDLGAGGWVYKSINKFVGTDLFLERMASGYYANAGELVEHLKKHLASLKSDPKFKDKLDEINEEQYLDWIEASFIANFQLNEHEHFVVEEVVGTDQKAVKLLMRDGKVSPDSNFGKGVQQFLTARMAELYPGENFHIKPETKAIISSNNKNFIDSYRMRERGFIWGGSGTPGSKKEIEEQEQKYGFEFAKLEPHKEKRVEEHQVAVVEGLSQTVEDKVIVDYEEPHFIKIYERLLEDTKNDKPCLVFFKDNTTANRFNDWLTAKGYFNDAEGKADATRRQVYTGSTITEAEVVKNAGKKGMITITTSAIGRNTDIKYQDPRKPNDSTLPNTLVVIHSFIDSTRVSGQKSGRTGRQGSKGDVYYIVSEKDLPKGTKAEDLREQMDEKGRLEREENEQFYNMMGLLFNEIKALPEGYFKTSKIDFIKQNWREFAAKAEENYHNRGEVEQSNDDFMQQRLVEFHDLMKANLKDESLFKALSWASVQEKLSYQHEKAERYEVYDKKVRVEDCTPPREIAYHLVHFEPNLAADKKAVDIENAIRVKLAGVFQDLDENKPEKHQDTYLKWLSGEGATREIVVKAHREFLQERFNTLSGKEANVFQRLFGYKSNLKKMVDNSSYLVLFHSLTSVSHDSNEQTEVDIVKKAAERLLQDYLDTAWFIKGNRKQWALDTIAELKGANTIDDVTAVLIKHQMAALADDMGESKNLHKGGQSRYLDALERSLRLAASFKRDLPEQAVSNQQRVANGQSSDKKEESATHKALKESIEKYNALPQRANEKPLTPDTFKEVNRADLKGRDKAAAKALASILELQSKKKTGMVGRNSKLFKERAGKEKAADDASADGIPDVNKGP